MEKTIIRTEAGNEYTFYRKGNGVYIVPWECLGLDKYESTKITRSAGLRKYHTRLFGGGFSFDSFNLPHSAAFFEDLGLHRKAEPKEQKVALPAFPPQHVLMNTDVDLLMKQKQTLLQVLNKDNISSLLGKSAQEDLTGIVHFLDALCDTMNYYELGTKFQVVWPKDQPNESKI